MPALDKWRRQKWEVQLCLLVGEPLLLREKSLSWWCLGSSWGEAAAWQGRKWCSDRTLRWGKEFPCEKRNFPVRKGISWWERKISLWERKIQPAGGGVTALPGWKEDWRDKCKPQGPLCQKKADHKPAFLCHLMWLLCYLFLFSFNTALFVHTHTCKKRVMRRSFLKKNLDAGFESFLCNPLFAWKHSQQSPGGCQAPPG